MLSHAAEGDAYRVTGLVETDGGPRSIDRTVTAGAASDLAAPAPVAECLRDGC